MTIDEAIKYLRDSKLVFIQKGETEYAEADQLGIEALKAVAKMRHYPFPDEILKLPGEDPE